MSALPPHRNGAGVPKPVQAVPREPARPVKTLRNAALLSRLWSSVLLMLVFFCLPLGGLLALSWAVGLFASPILNAGNIVYFVVGQLSVAGLLTWFLAWRFPVI